MLSSYCVGKMHTLIAIGALAIPFIDHDPAVLEKIKCSSSAKIRSVLVLSLYMGFVGIHDTRGSRSFPRKRIKDRKSRLPAASSIGEAKKGLHHRPEQNRSQYSLTLR